jgi:hypothetical protein
MKKKSDLKIPFDNQDKAAIDQLAQIMQLSPEEIIVQSVRFLYLYKTGKIQLSFPRLVDIKPIVEVKDLIVLKPDVELHQSEQKEEKIQEQEIQS